MAIAKGQKSSESASRTLYTGVGSVKVLAVNPTKKQVEELYGTTLEKEPEYVSEMEYTDKDGKTKKVKNVRISFVVKSENPEFIANHVFFVQMRYQDSQSGKYKIIDKYGRTAWATREEIEKKAIPMYTKKDTGEQFAANIDADYRPCYVGEEQLTDFFKKYLVIPNTMVFVNGSWVENTKVDKQDCECRLDKIENYAKGDFSELREYIGMQPENFVKVLFGVRCTDDNRMLQTSYSEMALTNATSNYSKLAADVESRKANGAYSTTAFEVSDIHEYKVDPTTLSPSLSQVADAARAGESAPW